MATMVHVPKVQIMVNIIDSISYMIDIWYRYPKVRGQYMVKYGNSNGQTCLMAVN